MIIYYEYTSITTPCQEIIINNKNPRKFSGSFYTLKRKMRRFGLSNRAQGSWHPRSGNKVLRVNLIDFMTVSQRPSVRTFLITLLNKIYLDRH